MQKEFVFHAILWPWERYLVFLCEDNTVIVYKEELNSFKPMWTKLVFAGKLEELKEKLKEVYEALKYHISL